MNEIKYIENGIEKTKDFKVFIEENNIDSVIRIHKKDFDKIDRKNNFFTHFNLRKAGHKKGEKYAVIKIIKAGGIDENGKEFFPTFDLSDLIITKCIDFKFKKNLEITDNEFKYSMKSIKNIEELKKEILFRYKKFRVGKTEEEIFNEGVSITELKILK